MISKTSTPASSQTSPTPSPSSPQSSSSSPSTKTPIPIIDFSPWYNSDKKIQDLTAARGAVAASLIQALKTVGFVYITNHGIPSTVISEAFAVSKRLFDLSIEDKMLAPHPKSPDWHRGYSGVGVEKVSQVLGSADGEDGDGEEDRRRGEELRGVRDCKESYEVGSEDCTEQPPIWLPESVLPGFRDFTTSFYWQCNTLAQELLSAMALGLNLPSEDFFKPFHSGHNNQLRLLHYPPIRAAEIEENRAARMPAHTDWPSITFLFQDECGGLQVEDPLEEGRFVDVEPVEGAMVMNVGDLMMRWSNDTLKSTMHRVTLPPLSSRFEGEERMTRERYSIPYFVAPDSDAVVECLAACIPKGEKAKYEPLSWDQYRRMRAGLQYERA